MSLSINFSRWSLVSLLAVVFWLSFAGITYARDFSGYAWSETIGWISLSGPGYGLVADGATGLLSGYAWSEHVGWVSANPSDLVGCPLGGPCEARINSSEQLTGWLKVLSGGTPEAGGFTGWIRLRGSRTDIVTGTVFTYGPSINATGDISGYAWGSTVVGWVDFSYADIEPYVPPPTGPSASCIYNPARNLFEAEYRWTAPSGFNTFYTRIADASGNLTTNPGWSDTVTGTTHRFDLSNSQATNPGFATNKDFTYWIQTRWLHPSDPTNPSLWRASVAVPVAPNNVMTCPLPAPLTPATAVASCVGSFASSDGSATFNTFAEFAARYNLEYTSNGSTVLLENQPALVNRTLPWGEYTWRVQGENLADRKGLWRVGNNFECRPPDPVLTFSASSDLVSPAGTTNLNWSIQANYPVSCTVTGGGLNQAVTHTGTPLQTSGTIATSPIINTTDFRFECTPNILALPNMPSVERVVRVDVVPVIEER